LILLVAMIGAIVLTLRDKPNSKRQNIAEQIARAGSVTNVAVPTGVGLKQLGIRRPPLPEEAAPKPIEHHHGHGGHH
jgi:NADH-quinone oxidoreductase subunit J